MRLAEELSYKQRMLLKEDWNLAMLVIVYRNNSKIEAVVWDAQDGLKGHGDSAVEAEVDLLGKLGCM